MALQGEACSADRRAKDCKYELIEVFIGDSDAFWHESNLLNIIGAVMTLVTNADV